MKLDESWNKKAKEYTLSKEQFYSPTLEQYKLRSKNAYIQGAIDFQNRAIEELEFIISDAKKVTNPLKVERELQLAIQIIKELKAK